MSELSTSQQSDPYQLSQHHSQHQSDYSLTQFRAKLSTIDFSKIDFGSQQVVQQDAVLPPVLDSIFELPPPGAADPPQQNPGMQQDHIQGIPVRSFDAGGSLVEASQSTDINEQQRGFSVKIVEKAHGGAAAQPQPYQYTKSKLPKSTINIIIKDARAHHGGAPGESGRAGSAAHHAAHGAPWPGGPPPGADRPAVRAHMVAGRRTAGAGVARQKGADGGRRAAGEAQEAGGQMRRRPPQECADPFGAAGQRALRRQRAALAAARAATLPLGAAVLAAQLAALLLLRALLGLAGLASRAAALLCAMQRRQGLLLALAVLLLAGPAFSVSMQLTKAAVGMAYAAAPQAVRHAAAIAQHRRTGRYNVLDEAARAAVCVGANRYWHAEVAGERHLLPQVAAVMRGGASLRDIAVGNYERKYRQYFQQYYANSSFAAGLRTQAEDYRATEIGYLLGLQGSGGYQARPGYFVSVLNAHQQIRVLHGLRSSYGPASTASGSDGNLCNRRLLRKTDLHMVFDVSDQYGNIVRLTLPRNSKIFVNRLTDYYDFNNMTIVLDPGEDSDFELSAGDRLLLQTISFDHIERIDDAAFYILPPDSFLQLKLYHKQHQTRLQETIRLNILPRSQLSGLPGTDQLEYMDPVILQFQDASVLHYGQCTTQMLYQYGVPASDAKTLRDTHYVRSFLEYNGPDSAAGSLDRLSGMSQLLLYASAGREHVDVTPFLYLYCGLFVHAAMLMAAVVRCTVQLRAGAPMALATAAGVLVVAAFPDAVAATLLLMTVAERAGCVAAAVLAMNQRAAGRRQFLQLAAVILLSLIARSAGQLRPVQQHKVAVDAAVGALQVHLVIRILTNRQLLSRFLGRPAADGGQMGWPTRYLMLFCGCQPPHGAVGQRQQRPQVVAPRQSTQCAAPSVVALPSEHGGIHLDKISRGKLPHTRFGCWVALRRAHITVKLLPATHQPQDGVSVFAEQGYSYAYISQAIGIVPRLLTAALWPFLEQGAKPGGRTTQGYLGAVRVCGSCGRTLIGTSALRSSQKLIIRDDVIHPMERQEVLFLLAFCFGDLVGVGVDGPQSKYADWKQLQLEQLYDGLISALQISTGQQTGMTVKKDGPADIGPRDVNYLQLISTLWASPILSVQHSGIIREGQCILDLFEARAHEILDAVDQTSIQSPCDANMLLTSVISDGLRHARGRAAVREPPKMQGTQRIGNILESIRQSQVQLLLLRVVARAHDVATNILLQREEGDAKKKRSPEQPAGDRARVRPRTAISCGKGLFMCRDGCGARFLAQRKAGGQLLFCALCRKCRGAFARNVVAPLLKAEMLVAIRRWTLVRSRLRRCRSGEDCMRLMCQTGYIERGLPPKHGDDATNDRGCRRRSAARRGAAEDIRHVIVAENLYGLSLTVARLWFLERSMPYGVGGDLGAFWGSCVQAIRTQQNKALEAMGGIMRLYDSAGALLHTTWRAAGGQKQRERPGGSQYCDWYYAVVE